MKEIGGYFELDQLIDEPFHSNMIELNTGRNALEYLIKSKGIEKIYIPHFLCNSISGVLDKLSVNYDKYYIDKDFHPSFNMKLKENEYLYVVNFFGQMSNGTVRSLKERFGSVILDNTQAFFQKPMQDIDTIYSLRKFFGLPDGAYLSTEGVLEEKLEEEKSSHRMKHILGRFEGEASIYYNDFKENDKSFKLLTLKKMSKLSKNILGAINYEEVRLRRNVNFHYLQGKLSSSNAVNIHSIDGPFSYPYYVKDGIKIRKSLAEKKIFIPTLWPNVLTDNKESTIEYDFASNLLPIPCDQRYDIEDMERILMELRKCIG